jgi:hypothetical protein
MSKQEDTINKAYSNMPKEVGYAIDWTFLPSWQKIPNNTKSYFSRHVAVCLVNGIFLF